MRYHAERIRDLVKEILMCERMSAEDAQITADALMDANLCGRDSHGFLRMKNYVDRLRKGGTKPGAKPQVLKETPVSLLIDGNDAMGIVIAHYAASLCRNKALESGMAYVLVRNGGHYGAGGYWGELIGQDDLIAINITDTEPLVVPFGGKGIALGTNPLTIFAPGNRSKALLYDVATSTIAQGKLFDYKLRHKKLSPGWAVDENGIETTDPEKAKYLTAFGGHKGYGLAVMIEALTSCLAAGAIGSGIHSLALEPDRTNNVSYAFFAMRPDLFGTMEDFRDRVDGLVDYLHAIPAAEGKSVLCPGEIEFLKREQNRLQGIDVAEDLEKELLQLAEEEGIRDAEQYFVRMTT